MQHFVARQPYCLEDSPLLQVLIDVRLGECGVGAKVPISTSLALMITTTLCYSATLGSSIADYGKPRRVDMGNVGKHISAVLFANSGTISKFSRMGQQGPYRNSDLRQVRSGLCYNSDTDATVPDKFSYEVGDPDFPEWWGQGLEMFHNPVAKHPIDREMVPEITHHRIEYGLASAEGPPFQPTASLTLNVVPRRGDQYKSESGCLWPCRGTLSTPN